MNDITQHLKQAYEFNHVLIRQHEPTTGKPTHLQTCQCERCTTSRPQMLTYKTTTYYSIWDNDKEKIIPKTGLLCEDCNRHETDNNGHANETHTHHCGTDCPQHHITTDRIYKLLNNGKAIIRKVRLSNENTD